MSRRTPNRLSAARAGTPRAPLPARREALLLAIFGALLFSGCGSTQTVRITSHRLNLTLEEYRILPHTVSVPPGPLRIVAHNRGILTHNVEVEREAGSTTVVLTGIPTLLPGASNDVDTRLAPGRYLLVSTVGNQAVLGMSSTLLVR
jgi:hypothetical protein